MIDPRKILLCPHCNHPTPQHVVHRQEHDEPFFADDGTAAPVYPFVCLVAVCEICAKIILYESPIGYPPQGTFNTDCLLWPRLPALGKSVPPRVQQIYAEAIAVMHSAPNAFSGQIRRALEALCEDRGLGDGTLAKRLSTLVARGELPSALGEMSDVLRLLGNVAVHETGFDGQAGHVAASNDFFRAIVEYIYVAPQQVREFRARLETIRPRKTREGDA